MVASPLLLGLGGKLSGPDAPLEVQQRVFHLRGEERQGGGGTGRHTGEVEGETALVSSEVVRHFIINRETGSALVFQDVRKMRNRKHAAHEPRGM